MSNTHKKLIKKPQVEKPLWRTWHQWKSNIQTNFKQTEHGDDWI
jgi:hypothetical protein